MSEIFTPVSRDDLPALLVGSRVVRVPRGLRSKEKLLGVFAARLEFPTYFGGNWDAFEECLGDLAWLPPGEPIVVCHEDLPFGDGPLRHTYLEILADWREKMQRSGRREVRLLMVQ
jgi:hypothetical protein